MFHMEKGYLIIVQHLIEGIANIEMQVKDLNKVQDLTFVWHVNIIHPLKSNISLENRTY